MTTGIRDQIFVDLLRPGAKKHDPCLSHMANLTTNEPPAPDEPLNRHLHKFFLEHGKNITTFIVKRNSRRGFDNLHLHALMLSGNILPRLEYIAYSYQSIQHTIEHLKEHMVVPTSPRRISLPPIYHDDLNKYVSHLPLLSGIFQSLTNLRMFPLLKVVELHSLDPVYLPFFTHHSKLWDLDTSGGTSRDWNHQQLKILQRIAVLKGIGTAINDSIGDGKEVIVDSVPIKCIDNPAVFSPSRLTIGRRPTTGHDSVYSGDEDDTVEDSKIQIRGAITRINRTPE